MKTFYKCKRILRAWWKKRETMSRLRHEYSLKKRVEKRVKQREKERAYRTEYRKQRKASKDIPTYLEENKWEKELNLKIWSTKGARFQAARRCEQGQGCNDSAGLGPTPLHAEQLR